MSRERPSPAPRSRGLWPHLRGHALRFDPRTPPSYPPWAGLRLLAIVVLLEGVIGPRLSLLRGLGLPLPPLELRAPLLLALALILVRTFAGLKSSVIGLREWRSWSVTEKSYLAQVVLLALVVFSAVSAERLRAIAADPALRAAAAMVMLTYLVWGFYQEVVYRGILQTELQRRWGSVPALLVANTLFTFGPLHFYHWNDAAPLPMFAAIFASGLFFGAVFWRSGNLWIVGAFHGIGDAFLTGLGSLT